MGTLLSRSPQKQTCQLCEHRELQHKISFAEMEAVHKKRLNEASDRSEREHKESLAEMETFYKEKLEKERSALRQLQQELKSVKNRGEQRGTPSCQRCKRNELEFRESLAEMDIFYKQKLEELRSALKLKEEELKSLKDRTPSML
ncbi:hypothetical protein Q5P01_014232 [Channa striata]|uniref:Uncharacterized protein n=1 Tax=Channa striata TaxID=64152 RepID=A0AA88SIN9_CHASR|nr:hypothetical protein Q5P01_014232 [Channa striata]